MSLVVLFDPSIGSNNLGDFVISRSARRELAPIIENDFAMLCGTHQPIATWYQNSEKNPRTRRFDSAKYKFVCGSNLLWKHMLKPQPSWNISLVNYRPYVESILVGVGTHKEGNNFDWYAKRLYRKVLNSDFAHSVRDEATKDLVEGLGFRAINTGCPTMWGFNDDFCAQIPTSKAQSVVFTLTDYGMDLSKDYLLVETLLENYEKIHFWPQGLGDASYLCELLTPAQLKQINVLHPSLQSFEGVLSDGDIDYVGTRLHAGMFAMQHKVRSIIVGIDNRVEDMRKTYSFKSINRDEMSRLDEILNSSWVTKIGINEQAIAAWKSQFI